MSVLATVLINSKYASNSAQDEYTTPVATRTIIDKFTATNTDSSAQTITVHLIPNGGSYGNPNLIIKALSIAANETKDITELQNQILAAGDKINAEASVANKVVIRSGGRECS